MKNKFHNPYTIYYIHHLTNPSNTNNDAAIHHFHILWLCFHLSSHTLHISPYDIHGYLFQKNDTLKWIAVLDLSNRQSTTPEEFRTWVNAVIFLFAGYGCIV